MALRFKYEKLNHYLSHTFENKLFSLIIDVTDDKTVLKIFFNVMQMIILRFNKAL